MNKLAIILIVFLILSSFVCEVSVAQGINDIGVYSVISPTQMCAGDTVFLQVAVTNFGANVVDSISVFWEIGGVLDSAVFNVSLDTLNGANTNMDTVSLGNVLLPLNALHISVWSKWPNGVQDSMEYNDTVNHTISLVLIAEFSNPSSFYTMVFTNLSQNATNYLGGFGDGTTDTVQNPMHQYPWTPFDYTCYSVLLFASSQCGMDSMQHGVGINLYGNPPNANINSYIHDWTVDFGLNYNDGSTPFWDFGDGGTASANHPTHIYSSPSSFECYTVSVVYGCDYDTLYKEIGVGDYPSHDLCDVIDGVRNLMIK